MAKFNNPFSQPREYPFINTSNFTITHNLGFKPMVYCIVDGRQAFCEVVHTDQNELVITFQNSLSGVIFLR